jgi:hypothetical protein
MPAALYSLKHLLILISVRDLVSLRAIERLEGLSSLKIPVTSMRIEEKTFRLRAATNVSGKLVQPVRPYLCYVAFRLPCQVCRVPEYWMPFRRVTFKFLCRPALGPTQCPFQQVPKGVKISSHPYPVPTSMSSWRGDQLRTYGQG